MKTLQSDSKEIISKIKNNCFNKGVIFAGLDWLLQKEELECLACEAKENNLQTMLYVGCSFDELVDYKLNYDLYDYIKCGAYKKEYAIPHTEYGVTLATINQHIYKKGVNY